MGTFLRDISQDDGWFQVESCALCQSEGPFRKIYQARDWHYGNPGEFRIVECKKCTLAFMDPMPDVTVLPGLYPSEYVPYQNPLSGPTGIKALMIKLTMPGIGIPHEPSFGRPGRLLDVGCGSGGYLLRARDRGWQVSGVELSRNATEQGRAHGLKIFCGTLREANLPDASFDYVRLNHVFEHLPDPNETLAEIKRILRPRGKLFIAVPNRESIAAKLFQEYWYQLAVPVHLFQWSPKTLTMMLQRHGFRVDKTYFSSDYSGLTSSFQIYRKRNSVHNREHDVGPAGKILGYWLAKGTDLLQRGDTIELNSTRLAG